ncbi:MAG: hypothetical protein U0992_19845 [Planctomycetaceae bacterium]
MRRIGLWIGRLLLAAAWIALVLPWRPAFPESLSQRFLPTSVPHADIRPLLDLTAAGAYAAILVGLLGFLLYWGLPGRRGGGLAQVGRAFAAITFVSSAVLLRYSFTLAPVLLLSANFFCAWSFGLARALAQGVGGMISFAMSTVLALVAIAAGLLVTTTEVQPAVVDMPAPTAQDRQRWQNMLSRPRGQDQTLAELRLTGDDLTLMAASWLAADSARGTAAFKVEEGQIQSQLTWPLNVHGIGDRFINVAATAHPTVANDRLGLGLKTLRCGRITVPTPLLQRMGAVVTDVLEQNPALSRPLSSIHALSVERDRLLVVCEPERVSQIAAEAIEESPDASEELRERIRVHMRRLVAEAQQLPEGDQRFLGLIRQAFAIASAPETRGTAVIENRAALIALGIQLGDPRVRRLAGFDPDEQMTLFPYKFDKQTTLRGRNDLARHFFVSAALRSLSTREVSFAVGLIKEQLDATQGGSGFSFADLAADLAGVEFAQRAISSETGAQSLQVRLSEPFEIGDLMPPIEGLPENLTQEQFREQYRSLTDARFAKVAQEVQARMKKCKLLEELPPAELKMP